VILLWGLTGDGPFDAVCAALHRRGARVTLVDQRRILETGVELTLDAQFHATVTVAGHRLPLDEARSAYWRTYDLRRLPAVIAADVDGAAVRAAGAVEEALVVWLEMTAACVVNRPSDMASNGSKPYQMEILRAHGFAVPSTLITTEPDEVRRFWTDSGAVIYKSVSGMRSVVSRLKDSHVERLQDVVWCPTQFQQFVPGRDHRVHVVGDDVFACEVISDAEDYRYAALRGDPPELRAVALPGEVAERCVALTRALRLPLAGIDLRRAPDGRWFCFEVNPSPGFTYYEAHTGQPIADAIASYLVTARSDSGTCAQRAAAPKALRLAPAEQPAPSLRY
jgi:glutathione synthase/RimK-type ligase-like ATP-grasp enzyme